MGTVVVLDLLAGGKSVVLDLLAGGKSGRLLGIEPRHCARTYSRRRGADVTGVRANKPLSVADFNTQYGVAAAQLPPQRSGENRSRLRRRGLYPRRSARPRQRARARGSRPSRPSARSPTRAPRPRSPPRRSREPGPYVPATLPPSRVRPPRTIRRGAAAASATRPLSYGTGRSRSRTKALLGGASPRCRARPPTSRMRAWRAPKSQHTTLPLSLIHI